MIREACLVLKDSKIYKIELLVFCIALVIYGAVTHVYEEWLNQNFSGGKIEYINRIFLVIAYLIFSLLIRRKTIEFIKKKWESLILLGYTPLQCLVLLLLTSGEILLMLLYFGSIFFNKEGIGLATGIWVNLINALILYLLGILLGIKSRSKIIFLGALSIASVLGLGIATRKLDFGTVYPFIMSYGVQKLLFSPNILFNTIKLVLGLCLLRILVWIYKNKGIDTVIYETGAKSNAFGDLLHRFRRYTLFPEKYFFLYCSRDFLLWKLFSTVIFLCICILFMDIGVIFLAAYSICVISTFYYNDVYNWEVDKQIIYFMSSYPLKKMLLDSVVNGIFILGDNILFILSIGCFFRPQYLFIFFTVLILIGFISIFINSRLIVKYPKKQLPLSLLCILIQFHLPLINVYLFYIGLRDGKRNWENFKL